MRGKILKLNILGLAIFSIMAVILALTSATMVQAESYSLSDLNISINDNEIGQTADYTISFTLPDDLSTGGSLNISAPSIDDYSSGCYSYHVGDFTHTVITAPNFTTSWQNDTQISLTPNTNLSSGSLITISLSSVINPDTEGTAYMALSGYDYSDSRDMSFYQSYYIRYDDPTTIDDMVLTITDSDGITPISNVWVYLDYYDYSTKGSMGGGDYEYFSQATDSNGQVYFNGLTEGRTYNISFSYYGTDTFNTAPQSSTITYNSEGQTEAYSFVEANVITHYCTDETCATPLSYSSWYIQDDEWRWITSGSTDESGLISAGIAVDGDYTLYIYNSLTYNTAEFPFTISSGVSDITDPLVPPLPNVTGQVLAGGSAVSNVYMYLYGTESVGDGMWVYEYSYTDQDGNFNFHVDYPGTYQIYVDSWNLPSGYSAPSATYSVTIDDVEVAADAITINLLENTKTISGTVKDAGGHAITDAQVYWYKNNGGYAYAQTDSSGRYSVSVAGGTWDGYIYPLTWPAEWAYTGNNFKVDFQNNTSTETATYNIQVSDYDAVITGRILMPNGSPVSEYEANLSVSSGNVWGWDDTDSSGEFSINVVGGLNYNLSMYTSLSEAYGTPDFDTISVKSGQTYDMGDIYLVEKNSSIQGNVTLNSGGGVSNTYVSAWKTGGSWDWANGTTDETGAYSLAVTPGTWQVYTWADYDYTEGSESYSYLGGAITVVVSDEETSTGNDFIFYSNDSTLNFRTIKYSSDESEQITGEYGWVSLSSVDSSTGYGDWYGSLGCYISNGSCELDLPAGTYDVTYYSYSGWGFIDEDSYTFSRIEVNGETSSNATAVSGENNSIDLVLAENDVAISGNFVDANGETVSNMYYGEVYATNGQGGYAYTWVSGDGSYNLNLSAGTWNLNYWIDPNSGYLSSAQETATITVSSGDVVQHNFNLLELDSQINVTAFDPDGNELSNVFVSANTRYGNEQTETAAQYGLISQSTYTDSNGTASIDMPAGTYYINASLPTSEGYLNPEPQLVTIDENNSANLTFSFIAYDSSISGVITDDVGITTSIRHTLAIGDNVSNAFIYAYSNNGYYSETTTNELGEYTLNVLQGETWNIGVIKEGTGYYYYSDVQALSVDEETESLDITLSNSTVLPEAQTEIFQSNEPKVITLSDGMTLNIPANALTAQEQQVTVTVTPIAKFARTVNDQPISYAYDLIAMDANNNVITQFASDVTISMPYDEVDLPSGVAEEDLTPEYFADSAGSWAALGSFTIDTENNMFVIITDHFSKYAIITGGDAEINSVPNKITGLTVPKKYRNTTQAKIKWTADSNAVSYKVQLRTKAGKLKKTYTVSNAYKLFTKKILKSNSAYKVRVRGVNANGEKGEWSAYKSFRTKPARVTKLNVSSITSNSAAVSFTKPRGTVKKYYVKVYRGKKLVKSYTIKKKLKKNTKEKTIIGLSSGKNYTVKVKTVYNANNKSSFRLKKFTTL
ncbi:MAG: fibronectin type III domain-containing protein [Patescibacteria group bacterium]